MEKSILLFNLHNLENVLQRNLRTGMARECIFRASGGTRFKNFYQPWCQKGGGETPRCNLSAQKKLWIRHCNNHSFPQSQQLTQATDIQEEGIRISINLPYTEGTSEKLVCTQIS